LLRLRALTNTLVRVSVERKLDILHAHYAVPHATAAYLTDQILASHNGIKPPKTVTTLHGTDITLVGRDPSYARVVAFSIERSHGVTAVSNSLRDQTRTALGITRDIRVIPNFLDPTEYTRQISHAVADRMCPRGDAQAMILHVSNFRPVKRVGLVLDVFLKVREKVRAKLVMVGDGPDRGTLEHRVAELGLGNEVRFVGDQLDLVPWLSAADLFLLPSFQESFGMAALEAMACEVVVIASKVGGLPALIQDGVNGFVCDPDRVDDMAARAVEVLTDPPKRLAMARAAAEHARTTYSTNRVVPLYEQYYAEVMG
jgi:N-acetyl-alpha-D-glucosaminyl L-malate synthase BshA